MKLSIYVIEDDPEFARALLQLLTANALFDVVGHAFNLSDAREFICTQSADIFLVDIHLPDGSSIEVMGDILQSNANAKIMVLSALGHEKQIMQSLKAGAVGYLLKSEMPDQILQSILAVANEKGALGPHASKVLINKLLQTPMAVDRGFLNSVVTTEELIMLQSSVDEEGESTIADMAVLLTTRELEVLKIIETGAGNKVVARMLDISVFTVNQHLRSIYRKFSVKSKIEAINAARQKSIL